MPRVQELYIWHVVPPNACQMPLRRHRIIKFDDSQYMTQMDELYLRNLREQNQFGHRGVIKKQSSLKPITMALESC